MFMGIKYVKCGGISFTGHASQTARQPGEKNLEEAVRIKNPWIEASGLQIPKSYGLLLFAEK